MRTIAASGLILRLFLGGAHAIAQDQPGENLPMYGQPGIVRSDSAKKSDEAFLRDMTFKYGSRGAASRVWADQGWLAFRHGKPDLALQCFNRAWLLNPKNYQAFWGFGAVVSDRGKLPEAIEHLETANQLIEDQGQKMALLSDLGSVQSELAAGLPQEKELDRAQHFIRANQRFAESLEIDPNYAPSWREWALSLYRQERYSEALLKAQRAIELKAEPFPANFLNDLRKKVAEAK